MPAFPNTIITVSQSTIYAIHHCQGAQVSLLVSKLPCDRFVAAVYCSPSVHPSASLFLCLIANVLVYLSFFLFFKNYDSMELCSCLICILVIEFGKILSALSRKYKLYAFDYRYYQLNVECIVHVESL